jgi:hypothetical protein
MPRQETQGAIHNTTEIRLKTKIKAERKKREKTKEERQQAKDKTANGKCKP